MPFEIGLAVATARWRPAHQWFLFEARPFRVQHTLSDLGGTDAYAHGEGPRRLLIALTDALVRVAKQPTVAELYRIFRRLSDESTSIRRNYGTLFGALAFRDLRRCTSSSSVPLPRSRYGYGGAILAKPGT